MLPSRTYFPFLPNALLGSESYDWLLAITVYLRWFGILYFLRGFKVTSTLIQMIFAIMQDIKWFLVVCITNQTIHSRFTAIIPSQPLSRFLVLLTIYLFDCTIIPRVLLSMSTSFNPICNSRIQVLAIFVFAVANSYFVLLNHNRVCTSFNETDSVDPEHGSECDVLGNKVLHY